jgi:hypothetical protein
MLMLRGLEVLFAPRGVFCIAASRLPLRCRSTGGGDGGGGRAMAELAVLAEADVGGG